MASYGLGEYQAQRWMDRFPPACEGCRPVKILERPAGHVRSPVPINESPTHGITRSIACPFPPPARPCQRPAPLFGANVALENPD